MKLRNIVFFLLTCTFITVSTSCSSQKDSPFSKSEWLMQNVDSNNQPYYHRLFLNTDNTVSLQASYNNSTNVMEWTGTYKITSKKIVFNFTQCVRYENKVAVGKYTTGRIIKYYTGDFLYSVGLVEDLDKVERYHLQLMRPEEYFYSQTTDIFGNPLAEFVKVN